MKVDDEIVELSSRRGSRPPYVARLRGRAEGLEILVIGAPLGEAPREDVDGQRDWWSD
jgi:hypothetical protein